jgi:hypothetical protein
VNDLGPAPDWDGIFDRAHRRIAGRMLLVGAVGAFCALLLLGGGLSAQGAVSLGIGGHAAKPDAGHAATKRKVKRKAKQHHRKRARAVRHENAKKKIHHKAKKKKHRHGARHHPIWNPCAGESLSSAEQQYCEGVEDGSAGDEPGAPVVPGPSGPVEPNDEPGSNQQGVPSESASARP